MDQREIKDIPGRGQAAWGCRRSEYGLEQGSGICLTDLELVSYGQDGWGRASQLGILMSSQGVRFDLV